MKATVIILLLILFYSCSSIYRRTVLGIKKPKIETAHSLQKFLFDKDIDTNRSFVLTDSVYATLLQKNTRYFATYEVYNKRFERLVSSDSLINQCYGNIELALRSLNTPNAWNIDSVFDSRHSSLLFSSIKTLYNTPVDTPFLEKKDYIVVLFWSKFMGKYSNSVLSLEKKIIDKNINNILFIKINMDKRNTMAKEYQEMNISF